MPYILCVQPCGGADIAVPSITHTLIWAVFLSIMIPLSVPGLSVPVCLFSIAENKNIDGRVGISWLDFEDP